MKIIYILFLCFIGFGIYIPLAYTDSLTPINKVEEPNLKVKLVQDAYDTVQNPYSPPLRYIDTESYKQMGYLKRNSSRLPLFGKPANLRRDMWYYYTTMDNVKLPITIKKRKCSVASGCSSVSSGDDVHVDGEIWKVELYEMDFY
jgi:hypothetical protein